MPARGAAAGLRATVAARQRGAAERRGAPRSRHVKCRASWEPTTLQAFHRRTRAPEYRRIGPRRLDQPARGQAASHACGGRRRGMWWVATVRSRERRACARGCRRGARAGARSGREALQRLSGDQVQPRARRVRRTHCNRAAVGEALQHAGRGARDVLDVRVEATKAAAGGGGRGGCGWSRRPRRRRPVLRAGRARAAREPGGEARASCPARAKQPPDYSGGMNAYVA